MDALILAGGKGTRLQSIVSDRPKVMSDVNGRPYLTYLFDQLLSAGINRVILCTGYMAEHILDYYGQSYGNLALVYSQETEPLGTGGAIRHALHHIQSNTILVLNGDSYCNVSLTQFCGAHHSLASMVLVYQSDTARYGQVKFDKDSYITDFIEKGVDLLPGWINAGIYLIDRELIENIPPDKAISIEQEMFPIWLKDRSIKGFYSQDRFIDIGLPKSYAQSHQFFATLNSDTKRFVALDRDGTIIKQIHYLSDPEQVELLPGAIEGIRQMRHLGLGIVVVTNQSAIGRGLFDETRLTQIHARMSALLATENIAIDAIYYCPATPEDNSPDRKPNPGMLETASTDLNFVLTDSFVIGDKPCDIELGHNVGATSILVRTGYGAETEHKQLTHQDYVVDSLFDASNIIMDLVSKSGSDIR